MFPALYAILDPALIKDPLAEFAAQLSEAGVELMQLRHKRATPRQLFSESQELVNWSRSLGGRSFSSDKTVTPPLGALAPEVRIIVNDRPDIAAMIGAGGVHVGQEDLPVEAARAICGSGCWVGISTHNLAQLREANQTSADYIAVGPIFPTATKENPDPVVGIDFLRLARQETRKPLVAIGGITIQSAAEVFRAGADSVAVIRDLLESPSPSRRAREYLAIAEHSRSGRA
ncbi:MAG TPA: thiamine phosphate synthase [Candidatus Acidoferrales bacterium]|nr:thiamine phosphate synthase [Candidatus Acidoferrales bacterium]